MTDASTTKEGKGGTSAPSARGERAPVTEDALAAALAAMPADKIAAILAARSAPITTTPKLSPALEAVPAESAEKVIEALHGALASIEAHQAEVNAAMRERRQPQLTEAMQNPLADVARVAPTLPSALQMNSTHRGKPLRHSVEVAIAWLTQRHGDDTTATTKARR